MGCKPPDERSVGDRYCLLEPVTRAQMASFLARALDLGDAPKHSSCSRTGSS